MRRLRSGIRSHAERDFVAFLSVEGVLLYYKGNVASANTILHGLQ